MEDSLKSLSKLFTEKLYRIPDYQRGYAWTEKQLMDFWGDLDQLEKDKKHYLGVLTLEQVPEKTYLKWEDDNWIIKDKSYEPYYVVDGQQRLTTAIILIQVIIESLKEEEKINYDSSNKIRNRYIFESKDEGISRSYIFGYEKDNPSYEFLKTRIFLEQSNSSETLQETIYTHNLKSAKNFFAENIKSLTLGDKEIIYRKLTQSLLFNIYTISSDIDVFVAFETMNNRGQPLSYLELLKNRLIYLSTKFEVEDYEKNKLRNSINETWKTMYHYLGKNKNKALDDDIFLSNHFPIYFGKSSQSDDKYLLLGFDLLSASNTIYLGKKRGFYSTYLLEKKFTVKSLIEGKNNKSKNNKSTQETLTLTEIYDYVQNLKESVELWYKIINPNDSDFNTEEKLWLEKLIKLSRNDDFFPEAPLLMVFFQKEKDLRQRVKLLKILEKIGFLQLLSYSRHEYAFLFVYEESPLNMMKLATELSKGEKKPKNIIESLEVFRDRLINKKYFVSRIKGDFQKSGFYNWHGIKYFLYEYELSLKEQSKTKRYKLNWDDLNSEDDSDFKTIEHIYPQNPRRDCWTSKFNHYTSQERKILRQSLGNLLPLSKPKNSSLGNRCFKEKVSNGKNIGYKYGSYSEIEVSEKDDWTAEEILERGLKLLNFMEERWGIKLGTRKDKIDFLNLGFVEEKEKGET
ncbi:DUF262 domain-containing protein [Dapis sp. BLCC M126]|uniref:DUF262 domain-containing protein n=1 Tax=Dapis sp. BLCC M126 TaxID=3400189 RepID=UPI003CEC9882